MGLTVLEVSRHGWLALRHKRHGRKAWWTKTIQLMVARKDSRWKEPQRKGVDVVPNIILPWSSSTPVPYLLTAHSARKLRRVYSVLIAQLVSINPTPHLS